MLLSAGCCLGGIPPCLALALCVQAHAHGVLGWSVVWGSLSNSRQLTLLMWGSERHFRVVAAPPKVSTHKMRLLRRVNLVCLPFVLSEINHELYL